VRIDPNGVINADGHNLNLYGVVLIRRNRICTSPEGARWACGQRAFVAMRNLVEGKSIACMFNHVVEPPKAACSVGDKDIAQFLLSEGWAELAEGVSRGHLCRGPYFCPEQKSRDLGGRSAVSRERPRRRSATEQRDELPSAHVEHRDFLPRA
jgi:endonuclease YncB( thermonuclease family)